MADRARPAYLAAGVDVAAGERAVELMRPSVEAAGRPEVLGGIGGFGASVGLPRGLREPVLVSAADGVGTKLAIATFVGRYDTVGHDLVAMCADDVVCAGAEPLFFLDYVAVGRLVPERVAEIVASIADGCRLAGCALVGGETAEHPGVMGSDDLDLAGFCVGVVERDRLLDGSTVRAGDALVGIASSGLHSNGFSLVRRIVAEAGVDLAEPYRGLLERVLGAGAEPVGAEPEASRLSVGEALLTPTRIYARAILRLRDRLAEAGTPLAGVAHVTGGGLPGNVPRMLPESLAAAVVPGRWPMPAVMRLLGALGGVDDRELRATFNGGLGMVVAVPPAAADRAIDELASLGLPAWLIGRVAPAEPGGPRYVELEA